MITLLKNTKEEFESEFKARYRRMRSPVTREILSTLYANALGEIKTDATGLARSIGTTSDDIIKKISDMNTIHGIKIVNKSRSHCKSDYKLVGFFKPRKRNRKKVAKAPVMMFQLSKNDQLINQVFC